MEAQASINAYFSDLQVMVRAISQSNLQEILDVLEETYHQGRRIFIMGNGGVLLLPRILRSTLPRTPSCLGRHE